jgi:hypothetical protein
LISNVSVKILTRSKIGREADTSEVCDAARTSDAVERSTSYCACQEANGSHAVCFSRETGRFFLAVDVTTILSMNAMKLVLSLYQSRRFFIAIDAALPLRHCGSIFKMLQTSHLHC